MKPDTANDWRCPGRTMAGVRSRLRKGTHLARISLIALIILVIPPSVGQLLFGQPIDGHQRKIDIRAHWGATFVSNNETPTEGVGGNPLTASAFGGSVSAAVGARLRLGMEVLQGRWRGHKAGLNHTLFSLLLEHEFWFYERLNPYLVFGVGYNHPRWSGPRFDPSLPGYRERKGRVHLGGGIGTRFFLTRDFFAGTELRIGVRPWARWTFFGGYAF